MIKNLTAIQNELKAPKDKFNSFGKYKYRSCESILEALKPILAKYRVQLTISDDVIAVGSRIYIKATATLTDADGNTESVSALAREEETKKGMDGSQITGTASSYARKYCLNGLFLIDDTKDADTDAYHIQTSGEPKKYGKEYMAAHGQDRLSPDEIDKLTRACAAAGDGWLEKAISACRCRSVEEITVTQYTALMSQLHAAA